MLRFFILLGFSFLFLHLHATGNISKYINMRYSYISFTTIFIFFFLTALQLVFYLSDGKKKEEAKKHDHEHDHEDCGDDHCHHHDHTQQTWKKWIVYPVLLIPVLSVLFLPVATLDSNIVKAKGFNFNVYNDSDTSSIHQFLQPDSSVYYGQEGYDEYMQKAKTIFGDKDHLVLNDKNYLLGLEAIYKNPGNYDGKSVTLNGFAYNQEDLQKNQLFLFRFGIIHCVADSGVFGMLVEFPKNIDMRNDTWLNVTGTITTEYYQPFKKTIPVLKVTKYKNIETPDDEYVYRNY